MPIPSSRALNVIPAKSLPASISERYDFSCNSVYIFHFTESVRAPRPVLIVASLLMCCFSARTGLLALSVQTYLYSLLQSLHLIHPYVIPSVHFLIPFSGEYSPLQFPPFPTTFTFQSFGNFFLSLLKAPPLVIYLYIHLKPIFEVRLYRLIRRQLPKPSFADESSIKVALDNDLIDWMVPTLGIRSGEENIRGRLTLLEDILCEISVFKRWVMSWFDFGDQGKSDHRVKRRNRGRVESPRDRNGSRDELGADQSRLGLMSQQPAGLSQDTREQAPHHQAGGVQINSADHTSSLHGLSESLPNTEQVFSNEENRMSHSPVEMDNELFLDMAARTVPSPNEEIRPGPVNNLLQTAGESGTNRHSRSNTLSSPLTSPGTSPPTSPRVRASLIHQNSDIITMQLELLTNSNGQSPSQTNVRPTSDDARRARSRVRSDRRSSTGFLDTHDPSSGTQGIGMGQPSDVQDVGGGLSSLTTGPASTEGSLAASASGTRQLEPNSSNAVLESSESLDAGLENGQVEEPGNEDMHGSNRFPDLNPEYESQSGTETRPQTSRSTVRPRSMATATPPPIANRITILSAHPVDSVASHAAAILTTTLFMPLESFYLRSLASSYLSSSQNLPSTLLQQDIRPLGAWGGGGSVKDSVVYMGKIAALISIHIATTAGVWSSITRAVVYIGRTFCGWGTL